MFPPDCVFIQLTIKSMWLPKYDTRVQPRLLECYVSQLLLSQAETQLLALVFKIKKNLASFPKITYRNV